ncbi:hypothetical protein P154DRAFT_423453 [Amniculicola lignicola CBS 123094]|uniref:Uncharacterized protein n=1 Tax=Amniculicola lignicola CBS 123094 TaxID=1392246 RepID=A0A6A5WY97_9PLEO|nr:hypothetical protein P154DRAFT_423453 [Amniculicola lignicola CBS 123094]
MLAPVTAPWGLRISDVNFQKPKTGFESQDMDHKWRVLVKDQSQSGNIPAHLVEVGRARNSTKTKMETANGVKIEAITWEQNKGGIVMITRRLLECAFEALLEYDNSDLWNHPAARMGAN